MRGIFVRSLQLWLPLLVVLTGVSGFAYLASQQSYRQSANDPQIQMAENIATSLSREYIPASVVPRTGAPVDIRTDLDPWIAVYDSSGTPLESNAVLDGAPPRMPDGLLNVSTWTNLKTFTAPTGPETHVTWQPRPGVRQAVTLVRFNTPKGYGFVAVGRSMRLTEERIIDLTYHAAAAWSVTALASFIAIYILLVLGWL